MKIRFLMILLIIAISSEMCVSVLSAGSILDSSKVLCSLQMKDQKEPEWKQEINLTEEGRFFVSIRAVFNVDNPGEMCFLKLEKPNFIGKWTLNGKGFDWIQPDVRYSCITGIPASFLKKGENLLEASDEVAVTSYRGKTFSRTVRCSEIRLEPQTERDFALTIGPVLGNAGKDFFTVKCISNLPAKLAVSVDGRKLESVKGFYHDFTVSGLKPSSEYEYAVSASLDDSPAALGCGAYKVRTLPEDGGLFFISVGDAQGNPKIWGEISEIIRKKSPMFYLRTGDSVQDGRYFDFWTDEFWKPAKALCSSVPGFYAFGNHEENTSIFLKIFATPEKRKTWYQEIGSLLLVGADIYDMEGRTLPEYLDYIDGILSKAKAKFIFFLNHAPAWSSAAHGGNDTSKEIFKLLEKHKVTAMLSGHEHCYERSEPGNGTSMIVSGGGSASLYSQKNIEKNPFSKVFVQEYNYLAFTIEGDICEMKAYALGDKNTFGKEPSREIDSRTWKARTNLFSDE